MFRQMAVGVIGALAGGAAGQLVRGQKVLAAFSGESIIAAVVAAVLFVVVSSLAIDRHTR